MTPLTDSIHFRCADLSPRERYYAHATRGFDLPAVGQECETCGYLNPGPDYDPTPSEEGEPPVSAGERREREAGEAKTAGRP